MAVRPVYNCFHPILNKPTRAIEQIDAAAFQLAQNLFDTLKSISNGVGLAANQIGADQSIFVIDVSQVKEYSGMKPFEMINPVIEEFDDDEIEMEEGCLSVPDLYEGVVRPKSMIVRYFDLNQKEYRREVDGFLARVMMHEIDHLDGILFFQRFSTLKKTLTKNKLKKIRNSIILPDYPYITAEGELITP